MNKFIILALLVAGIAAQSSSITPCACAQLLSTGDCTASSLGCAWNATTNACATNTGTVTPTITYAQYCDNFSETDCPKTTGCAWVSSKCTFFTGCTPFAKTTDSDCQAISNRCITDGTHCVEVTICSAFIKQLPCVKNSSGAYCYWDTKTNAALPVCVDANTCDKLPATLTTDKLCRDQISTCTTTGTGCITSGTNCSDQTAQISCVWNLAKSQACYWTGSACVDLKCENAPTTLTTDDACKAFTTSGTCTTKSGGGCITRTTCSAATIQAACVTNSSGSSCYWNTTACVDKTCANAPSTLTTNSACSGFLTTCITTGTGCVTNTTCSSATIQAACVSNASGTTCIWDTTCKEKYCTNAPAVNNSHTLCTSYLSTCTVNASSNGCTNRTCANAPSTLVSNTDCETYLPNSKCITKTSGGCVTNTTCGAITVQGACVADASGTVCFWDPTGAGSCKDKSCINAPSSYTDDATCSGYLKTCTVAAGGAGCVNRTCENLLSAALCTTDLNNKPCIFKALCYMKQCALASSAFNTHADCNGYLGSCTLSNTGTGCVPIPLVCSAITTQGGCYLKKVVNATTGAVTYANCGWNGSQCIDWGCTTLATTNTTTASCEASYASHYCVSANPVNGTVAGCIDLPTSCSARKTQDNCEVTSASGTPKCIWNLTLGTPACVDKSCDTASAAGTTGVVVSFTNSNCGTYLSTCIANNTATGCIAKPTSCTSLAAGNCGTGSKTTGDCYWGASCVDKTCANITLTSHGACKSALSSCTVKADGTGCMNQATTCSTYTSSVNCYVTSTSKNCVWTGVACRSATCNDAIDDAAYATDTACLAYPAVTETCTVLYKVAGLGCVSRSANCSDYTSQDQCYRTISAASDDCLWTSSGICFAKSSFATGACTTFKGTQADCELYRLGCTNVVGAVATDACTFSCAKKTGVGLTFSTCQTFDASCSVNLAATACIAKQATCVGYSTAAGADCVQTSSTALCVWKSTGTAACQSITVVADCALKTGTGLTHATCQTYSTLCTANVAGDACQEYTVNCAGLVQTNCTKASTDGLCAWKTTATAACIKPATASTDCVFVTGTGLTDTQCASYLSGCNADVAKTACQEAKALCSDYVITSCTTTTTGGKCFWDTTHAGGAACVAITSADCALVTTASMTHDLCNAYNSACTVLASGTGCIDLKAACAGQANTECLRNTAGAKCYWYTVGTPACIQISTASSDCVKVTGVNLTFANCQAYNTSCSVKRDGTGCVQLQAACTGYSGAANIAGCANLSATSLCIANSGDTSCAAASTAATCEAVYLGAGNYSHANCDKFKTGCTNNSTTGCATKTCANYNGSPTFTHSACNTWLSTCTVNQAGSGCATMPSKCNDAGQTSSNCIRAVEGACVVVSSACVKMTCDTAVADATRDDDTECSAYLSTCTVARTGGCQARTACASYKSALQCKTNSSGAKCFWNPTSLTCVDLSCANVEQTTAYDSHSECIGVDSTLKCTVRAASGASVAGCMARTACASYTIQDQCVTNSTGGVCEWNTNLATPACADKACATAATGSYTTHLGCNGYLNTCTAAVVVTNGVSSLAGCQLLAACATYTMSEQCVVDAAGVACGWNGTVCANKSCVTAPATADYSTDTQCRAYFTGCTVAASGQGCIAVAACESYTVIGQCISNTTGASCYWNATTSACITRSCENAPSDTTDCNSYLAGCTSDAVKCKTKICEDFALATDSLCQAALSTCTSNGTNCVTRGTCAQATTAIACVTQSNGAQCQWIATNGAVAAYCTVKTCATAPTDIVTESACQTYFSGCTTKSGGGCTIKSSCAAANVQAACTKDSTGTITCQWDSTANACRNKACGDYSGSTHAACQGISTSCTAGANGFCATIATCANTKVRAACVSGSDGPCLWIAGYSNTDGTKGACFPYTSCKSLTWSSNTSCNLISDKCTTNGTNCVGITLCTETNTNGGCVNGYDGACIQSVDSLGSTNAATCRAYTSCADAFYATHAACQTASSKCTTNGTTGCIALGACSTYTQAGCFFNNVGSVYTSGALTSTGICTWDTTASACRDQNCSDLTGANHAACSAQLSSCTSDGTKCIAKAACSTYAQAGCSSGIGVGSDGLCFWDSTATTPACRPMVCGDVVGGTSTAVCSAGLSGCVSDGAKCIAKASCSTYTTKISCNSGGTDGICVFTASTATGAVAGTGTCKGITACADAASDQTACTAVKDRCSWTAATTGTNATASKCTTHTCGTYQSTVGVCGNFLNWGKTLQQVCTVQNATCSATDASTLTSANCYSVSGYTYTWSSTSSKCGVCTTPVVTPNTTNNTNTTNTTNTTTTHGYILGFASVILGYLVL